MDIEKLEIKDMRSADAAQLKTMESDIRRKIVDLRLELYLANRQKSAGLTRNLKKNLARLLTVRSEKLKDRSREVKS